MSLAERETELSRIKSDTEELIRRTESKHTLTESTMLIVLLCCSGQKVY